MSDETPKGIFTRIEELDIENLAEGLSPDEVASYVFGCLFAELPPNKQREFMKLYTRGAVRFKIHAINSLKQSMSGRTALQSSLAVLLRFSDNWKVIADDRATNGQFVFKIVDDGDG